MNSTIVFINPGQFGYKAGYYYYCKYLKDLGFNIEFLCFDQGHEKIVLPGVNVEYIPLHKNKIVRTIKWQIKVKELFQRERENTTSFFINYFQFCAVFGILFPKANKILDIRTGSIKPNKWSNLLDNFFIRLTTMCYDHITILSEGLVDHLKLNKKKCQHLPLGSEVFMNKPKEFDSIRMLYVGTFNKRRIHETVKGLHIYLKNSTSTTKITYDIFGDGSEEEMRYLNESIQSLKLEAIVTYHGRKNHEELKSFFDTCNVGVSYIPKTSYFEYQPPTKTFEYVLSGMVCIATSTFENKKLIDSNNGILCEDNSEDFAKAIEKLVKDRNTYDSFEIQNTLKEFTWENIVQNRLIHYLNKNK